MRPEPDRLPLPRPPTGDRSLGEGTFFGKRFPVRMRVHSSTERFSEPAEINWFRLGEGMRTFVTIRAYVQQPHLSPPDAAPLHSAASPSPAADAELDALFGHPGESEPHIPVGVGSAWHYPAVRGILLWEFCLAPAFRRVDPVTDPNLPALWLAFEAALLEQFPDTRVMVTPSWDPLYDRDTYDRFLFSLGYAPHAGDEQLFIKLIEPS